MRRKNAIDTYKITQAIQSVHELRVVWTNWYGDYEVSVTDWEYMGENSIKLAKVQLVRKELRKIGFDIFSIAVTDSGRLALVISEGENDEVGLDDEFPSELANRILEDHSDPDEEGSNGRRRKRRRRKR